MAAKPRSIEVVETVEHRHGGERLVVAGVVEQACRDVDGIAEIVARHLDDFALCQPDLEFQSRA